MYRVSPEWTALMVAVVFPPLRFAPPASDTVSAFALAQAGSAAPAARTGGLAAFIAVTVSAASAWEANAAVGNNASMNSDVFLMTRPRSKNDRPTPTNPALRQMTRHDGMPH
jgi:hypothetical protein